MKFIVRLDREFDLYIKKELNNANVLITHIDKTLKNLIIVESEKKKLVKLPFIKKITPTRKFRLLNFSPSKKPDFEINIVPNIFPDLSQKKETDTLIAYLGLETKVLVIDSGYSYVDENIRVEDSKIFTPDDPYILDRINHGNIVTSLIHKYSPGSSFYFAKVCSYTNEVDEEMIYNALNWAYELEDLKIINISIGGEYKCTGNCDLAEKINSMKQDGYIIVISAGNGEYIHCPACASEAITVGALNQYGNDAAETSAKGLTNISKPDFLAPSYVDGRYLSKRISCSGTSFSAPIISGMLASTHTHLQNDPKTALILACDDLNNSSFNRDKTGFGKINVLKFLEGLKK